MEETVIQIYISRYTSYGADADPMIISCVQKLYELSRYYIKIPCRAQCRSLKTFNGRLCLMQKYLGHVYYVTVKPSKGIENYLIIRLF